MDFTAIDFETGNSNYISACSIGVSVFKKNKPYKQYSSLINPPEQAGEFHWYNIKIHGILKSEVTNKPYFPEIWKNIYPDISNSIVVCHNASFDTVVLKKCLDFYNIEIPNFRYLCTVKISQKLWPNLENHKLDTVSKHLKINLEHHNAGSDAHACGLILHNALKQTCSNSIEQLANKLDIKINQINASCFYKN